MSRKPKYLESVETHSKAYTTLYAALDTVRDIEKASVDLELITKQSGLTLDEQMSRHQQRMHIAHAEFLRLVPQLPLFAKKLVTDFLELCFSKEPKTEWQRATQFYAGFLEKLDELLSSGVMISEFEPSDQILPPNFWLLSQISGEKADVSTLSVDESYGYTMRYVLSYLMSQMTGKDQSDYSPLSNKEFEDCLFDNDIELEVVGKGLAKIYLTKTLSDLFSDFDVQLQRLEDIKRFMSSIDLCLQHGYESSLASVTDSDDRDSESERERDYLNITLEGVNHQLEAVMDRIQTRQLAAVRELEMV